jgi:hypothetical protein
MRSQPSATLTPAGLRPGDFSAMAQLHVVLNTCPSMAPRHSVILSARASHASTLEDGGTSDHVYMLGSFSEVSLLSYQSWTDDDSVAHLETLCRRVVVIDAKPPDSKLQRALSLGSVHSYQYRAHRSAELQRTLDAMVAADDYDVVMVDLTPMGQFRLPDGPLRVLDLHNIEHELVERRAATARRTLRRATLGLEARKVRREELAICRRFDLLLTTSDRRHGSFALGHAASRPWSTRSTPSGPARPSHRTPGRAWPSSARRTSMPTGTASGTSWTRSSHWCETRHRMSKWTSVAAAGGHPPMRAAGCG